MRAFAPVLVALVVCLVAAGARSATAPDWPQWGGATRDFRVASVEAAAWPQAGLRTLWQRPLGEGYSGIVTSGGVLYSLERVGDEERVLAIAAETGATRWTHDYPAPRPAWLRTNHGVGPRSTPLVAGERLFTVGINGTLLCLEAASGKRLWRQELVDGLGGTRNTRGYSASPLAFGDLVVVPVGGKGRALVALRQADGAVTWQSGDFERAMSSPFVAEVGGAPQLIALLDGAVTGFDPASGRLLWSHPHGGRGERNVSAPLWDADGRLFVSSAYGGGSRVLQLRGSAEKTELTQLWASESVRLMFTNAMRIGTHVYLSSGDFGPVPLTALAVDTGQVAWRDRTFGRLNMVKLGERLLVLDEAGVLGLVSVSPEGLTVHSRMSLPPGKAWVAPTVVGRRVYVRTEATLFALELP